MMGKLELSPFLSDGMLIQRDAQFPVRLNEKADVNFLGKKYEASQIDGKWLVMLDPSDAGGPFTMEIRGSETVTIKDIFIGEIWLCAGQSNMEMQMARPRDDYPEEWHIKDYPIIRQFKVPQRWNFAAPCDDLQGGFWQQASNETLSEFSAVAWFFAKEMYKKHKVPIGLINTAWGGTPVESWMSREALSSYPEKIAQCDKFRDEFFSKKTAEDAMSAIVKWEKNLREKDLGAKEKWEDPKTDISGWKEICLPGDFSQKILSQRHGGTHKNKEANSENLNGLEKFCGIIWLAKEFDVSAEFAHKEANAWLGTIIDADTVYINGTLIGNTPYRYPPRKYAVKEGILKEGKNRIVIRVSCNNGEGGVTSEKPFRIFTDNETVQLTGTWKYEIGASCCERPQELFFQRQPVGNFNAMISPVLKYPLKGVIWYQGESNDGAPHEYKELFQLMIKDWRGKNRKDLPFFFVQLPVWKEESDNNENHSWAIIREAQAAALSLPNTGMAAALELGEWNDLHPINKKDVGHRLFLAAEKLLAGEDNSSPGPVLKKYELKDEKIYLYFDNCGLGLIHEENLTQRRICDTRICDTAQSMQSAQRNAFLNSSAFSAPSALKKIYVSVLNHEGRMRLPAEIEGKDCLFIDITGVNNPKKVLYAWADNPRDRQLFNSEGLPAIPFKIDL